jgi:hypothetical protein
MGVLFTVNEYILFASQGGDPNFIIEKFRIKGIVPRDYHYTSIPLGLFQIFLKFLRDIRSSPVAID